MRNSIKLLLLWISLRGVAKNLEKNLVLLRGSEGSISQIGDTEEILNQLRLGKLKFQENSIIFENAGHEKISKQYFGLKKQTEEAANIVKTWKSKP